MMLHGDCLERLKLFDENSVDSLVTDPPAGIEFMNKKWDKSEGFVDSMSEIFKECLRVLKPGAHGLVWAIPRTSHKTATALEQAGFEIRDVITHIFGSGYPKNLNLGQGRGTALKPASEHWILIRKPISEDTIAKNVLEHGTGGLNIDVSRVVPIGDTQGRFPSNLILSHNVDCELIGTKDITIKGSSPTNCETFRGENGHISFKGKQHPGYKNAEGKETVNNWNCTEECAVEELDKQSGVLKSGGGVKTIKDSKSVSWNEKATTKYSSNVALPSQGGASRFFYVAKASKSNRGEGNSHPTVKSTKLMDYLIKLITPPNGIVLDPFMGSGTTGVSAKSLGFSFIGIEKEKEYFDIANKRIIGDNA